MVKEVIETTVINLKEGNTILYPTDTVWGLGCDATNEEAVRKIYRLKRREESKSLIILVDSIEMLQKYIEYIPKQVFQILETVEKPTTIIYNNPKRIANNAVAIDNTVAIRIPKNEFCQKLIKEFGKPIVSTSANISGEVTPKTFKEISNEIKLNVDYVVEVEESSKNIKPSTILKIMIDGSIKTLRA